MAYITKEETAAKRAAIKAAFPLKDGWKFSVTGSGSTLDVYLMEYPAGLSFPESADINHYWIEESIARSELGEVEAEVCKKAIAIMAEGHWDKSDIMTDYFNCSYYYYFHIGKWNKPAAVSPKTLKEAA